MRLPIFQLTWEAPLSKAGLMFPSEAESDIHSFIFAAPILIDNYSIPDRRGIIDQLRKNRYYFPSELEGKYIEIEGTYEDHAFSFLVKDFAPFKFFFNSPIGFRSEIEFYKSNYIYRGTYSGLENYFFLPIIPADIGLLNAFFWQSGGLFVGFTPQFDESGFIDNVKKRNL